MMRHATEQGRNDRQETEYRDVIIRTYDVPCTPYVWTHDELDGHGQAETIEKAKRQIDRHLALVATCPDSEWSGQDA